MKGLLTTILVTYSAFMQPDLSQTSFAPDGLLAATNEYRMPQPDQILLSERHHTIQQDIHSAYVSPALNNAQRLRLMNLETEK